MKNVFKKGLILGGLLVATSLIGSIVTKKAGVLSDEFQLDLKHLAKQLKLKLKTLEDITKEQFNELVDTLVTEYVKKKPLLIKVQDILVESLKDTWAEMEEAYEDTLEGK